MLDSTAIARAVAEAIPRAACELRPDVLAALERCRAIERSSRGITVLEQLIHNASIAARDRVPVCQDTGTVWVLVELGVEECLGGDVFAAIHGAVASAYRDASLRMSLVHDALIDRANTGDNTPPFVEIVPRAGRGATVHVMLKGGGSDNASRVEMLSPDAGFEGVRDLVLEVVTAKATGACPPLLVGVGVGATFDKVGGLAKRALLRTVGSAHPDERVAEFEAQLLAAVNATGIGPAGLGGDCTAVAVHINTAPCHIAALPVAINMGCCAVRSASIEVVS